MKMNVTNIRHAFTALFLFPCVVLRAQDQKGPAQPSVAESGHASLIYSDEKHFKNMRQLTFGGDNAEAYFGFDNEHITFQRQNPKEGVMCDQIYYGAIP